MRQNLPKNGAPEHDSQRNVVPLNDAGAVFDALAQEIKGSAIGWPAGALDKLEAALLDRYGQLIGGPSAVNRLLVLAQQPTAA